MEITKCTVRFQELLINVTFHTFFHATSMIAHWPGSTQGVIVCTRVSDGTGQCNFSGQRDRSFFLVPGQRDNKSHQGPGRAGTAKIRDGTGRDSQNPGRDAGQNGTGQKRMF